MAIQSGRSAIVDLIKVCCYSWPLCTLALVAGEACLLAVIIKKVAFNDIDYSTYLEQAALVKSGVRDYAKVEGAQGPLVYPAGHVWLYAAVGAWADGSVIFAQRLFAALYVLDQLVVARIYAGALSPRRFPPVLLALLATSKRAHSVFALRLFNDGPNALLCHLAVLLLMRGDDVAACVVYSIAVSIKMSALLYAPAVYLVLAARRGHRGAWLRVGVCALVQVVAGWPFLTTHPVSYLANAFNFGRGFKHAWSVNFKWVPCAPLAPEFATALADCDGIFSSTGFKVSTLAVHLAVLLALADRRWLSRRGGFLAFMRDPTKRGGFSAGAVARLTLGCNFVGVACARSLHFQFRVWYANAVPLLLASTQLPWAANAALLVAIEAAWNPWGVSETSSVASSVLLTGAHLVVLAGLFLGPDAGEPEDRGKKRR